MGMRRRSAIDTLPFSARIRQRWELPNGIRLITEQVPSAYTVAVGVWLLAGSRDEDPYYNGIAHLLEHLVAGASQHRTARQLAVNFEQLGTELTAYTTKEFTCYSLQTLRPYLPRTLRLLAELLMAPRLTQRAIHRERRIIIEELLAYADDPEEVLYEHAERTLFGTHPLGMPIAGTVETLQHITEEAVAAFHAHFYVGEAISVTLVGDLCPEEAYALVSEAFGTIPRQRLQLPPRLPPEPQPAQEVTLSRPLHQAYVLCTRLIPKLPLAERVALAVADFLLGEGWSSRLYQRIRERHGLAYTVFSELEWFSDCGMWSIYLNATPSVLPSIERLVRQELQRLCQEGINDTDLARARRFLQARIAMTLDNPVECMSVLARTAADGISDPFLSTFHSLEELSRDKVNALVARFCNADEWSWIRIVPQIHG